MGFFIAMFICNLLIPIIMLVAGLCMYFNPPKAINNVIGYRTARSKKNMDTWLFAHKCCGRIWSIVGAVLLVASIAVQLPYAHADEDAVGIMTLIVMGVQIALLLLSIVPVEKALDKKFDEEGKVRE